MRYEPRIGDEFHLTGDVIAAKTRHLTEVTRSTIALCIILASLVALAFAAALGALKGDFGYLQTLWAIIAAPLGGTSPSISVDTFCMAKKTTRVQLELPESSFERLKNLRDKTEASSYAEVMKNALRLYEALISQAENGNELCIRDSDGTETRYRLLF
jgi:hypothetical protein